MTDQPENMLEALFNGFLNKSVYYFKNGNIPQSELFARKAISIKPSSEVCNLLLNKIYDVYGLNHDFKLSENQACIETTNPKYLLIKAWGYGFWSEIHYLVTYLLIAELLNRTPIVLWGKNCLYRSVSEVNSFENFYSNISDARIEHLDPSLTIYPKKWSWSNILSEDVNKWSGTDSRMTAQYFFNRKEDVLVSDFYTSLHTIIPWISPSSKYFNRDENDIYRELFQKYLKPNLFITDLVNRFFEKYMEGKFWLAVHLRGGDKIHESPELALTNGFYDEYIKLILNKNPFLHLFLLTDSIQAVNTFKSKYGDRVLTTQSTRTECAEGVHNTGKNDGLQMGREVLVDTLLATRCDFFVGNQESNVSLAISSIKNWSSGTCFLIGLGNVRGENIALHDWPKVDNPEAEVNKVIASLQLNKKRIIQVFKPPGTWKNSPPGLGDFIRGSIHLYELLRNSGIEFRVDLSQTEFNSLIDYDPEVFYKGTEKDIASAEEYFVDHGSLRERIVKFATSSDQSQLYICSNLGDWNRLILPDGTKKFAKSLFKFSTEVNSIFNSKLANLEYQVLSIRCGDLFYVDSTQVVNFELKAKLEQLIEAYVLPRSTLPILITSDSYDLKITLAKKYGMLVFDYRSEHGALGNVLPVAVDLNILKNSKFNFHINCWAPWWSGFSHYTSRIFDIPSMNFRAPLFQREEITASGELLP